jgi:hypothetical protein
VNLRFLEPIWHIRGSMPLPPNQTHDEAFDRLMPLFRTSGTTHERSGETLTFLKKDQEAQDKMSVFDRGVLHIDHQPSGAVLRYRMASRALLYCFLAPLLFLAIAQVTVMVADHQKASAEASQESDTEDESKKDEARDLPQHAIDKALGAPAPELPDADEAEEEDEGPSPTPAYVFAAIFVALYIGGRILEDHLIKRLFRRKLYGEDKPGNGSAMLSA